MTNQRTNSISPTITDADIDALISEDFGPSISAEESKQISKSIESHTPTREACLAMLCTDKTALMRFCSAGDDVVTEFQEALDSYETVLNFQLELLKSVKARLTVAYCACGV